MENYNITCVKVQIFHTNLILQQYNIIYLSVCVFIETISAKCVKSSNKAMHEVGVRIIHRHINIQI